MDRFDPYFTGHKKGLVAKQNVTVLSWTFKWKKKDKNPYSFSVLRLVPSENGICRGHGFDDKGHGDKTARKRVRWSVLESKEKTLTVSELPYKCQDQNNRESERPSCFAEYSWKRQSSRPDDEIEDINKSHLNCWEQQLLWNSKKNLSSIAMLSECSYTVWLELTWRRFE